MNILEDIGLSYSNIYDRTMFSGIINSNGDIINILDLISNSPSFYNDRYEHLICDFFNEVKPTLLGFLTNKNSKINDMFFAGITAALSVNNKYVFLYYFSYLEN